MPFTVTPTSVVVEAELAGAGGGWTDLSADVLIQSDIQVDYGIQGGGPSDRVAATGTMSWLMDNSTGNSGALLGYYSPGHTNARSGWDLGIQVRLSITYGGTTYYKFRGTLVSIEPDAGQYLRRGVMCMAVDWMDEAARTKIRDIAVLQNYRSDQIINEVITNSITRQPAATSLATGQGTFEYAMDNLRDESTTALQAIADAVISEVGYFYVKGDTAQGGTVVFEDRHARPKKGAASGTFNETMYDLVVSRNRDELINHLYLVCHPRKVDASVSVIYELTSTELEPEVPAGSSRVYHVLFRESTGRFIRIGAKDLVTPVANTDYVANSQAVGGGWDLSSDVSLVISTATSNGAVITLTNNNATTKAFFTTMQVRGKAIADTYQLLVEATNSASQASYGEVDASYDLVYEGNAEVCDGIANWFISTYGDPDYRVGSVSVHGNKSAALLTQVLAREPGDKIALVETVTGITNSGAGGAEIGYFIQGCSLTIGAGQRVSVTWTLSPAAGQNFWILEQVGASELGVTTVLGFA